MKVLIVPDKFKGTLTAAQAAQAIAQGWRSVRAADSLDPLPMSDGGDGFGEVMSLLMGATTRTSSAVNAAQEFSESVWWWDKKSGMALVEAARVVGLAQLPRGKYHPFDLDTRGLGMILKAAVAEGRRCLVGIGGSATNDGGFGMARELGWRFADATGAELTRWTELERLSRVTRPALELFEEITVAVDVQNPLLGPEGCTRVYGPQKGLRVEDFALAERCLERLAVILKEEHGLDFANQPGAGAAGGLGFGLMAFTGARLAQGFELFARHADLKNRMGAADLVITAEGAIDRQTLMGKGVGQIAAWSRDAGLPCVALAGAIQERAGAGKVFDYVHALTDLTSTSQAMNEPAIWLERLAARAAEQFKLPRGK